METQKPLLKDEDGEEVDVYMYMSMIGSLMYLTSSRPGIMFVECACARYQVNPKVSHLHAVKMNFRYLKGQPNLDLWYPKDYPFDLVAYTDSDYAEASLDRKSTTGGKAKKGVKLMMEKLFRIELELMLNPLIMKKGMGVDAFTRRRIDAIDADEKSTLVVVAGNVVSTAGDATTISVATTTTATITTVDDITLAQALMEIKSTKPKEKRVVIQELGESTTTISSQLSSQQSHDKGKGILIEPDDTLEKINADHQLAEDCKHQEQGSVLLSIEEKEYIISKTLENEGKPFTAKKSRKEKRNKPLIKAQQRQIIIQKGIRTELVEGKENRARTELIQENEKKQKVEDGKETAELYNSIWKSFPDKEEVTIVGYLLDCMIWKICTSWVLGKKINMSSTRDTVEDLDLLLWGDLKTSYVLLNTSSKIVSLEEFNMGIQSVGLEAV
ncbi:hypothetical protein Tco_0413632 [Tanacetum coccineum]